MTGLLQISDPHFGTEQPAAVEALCRLVAARRPAAVLLSGDITQRATRTQFALARAFVDRLAPVPVLCIPGNHDIPLFDVFARLLNPYARYTAAFGPLKDAVFSQGGWFVLLLNTTRAWRHKNGEVSARQVALAAARLRDAPAGALKLLVTHQPVAVTQDSDIPNLLRGREAALRAWQDAGADMVLGGHIHLPFVLPLHDAAHPRPFWAVQAGTAVSTRVRHGTLNSVTELSAGSALAPECSVRFWDWPGANHDFVAREPVSLALAPR